MTVPCSSQNDGLNNAPNDNRVNDTPRNQMIMVDQGLGGTSLSRYGLGPTTVLVQHQMTYNLYLVVHSSTSMMHTCRTEWSEL